MKIILHLVFSLHGGVASVAANLIRFHQRRGDRAILAYFDDDVVKIGEYLARFDEEVETIRVRKRTGVGANMMFGLGVGRIYRKIKQEHPKDEIVVHAHNTQTLGIFSLISRIPLVCTIHGINNPYSRSPRAKISLKLSRMIMNRLLSRGRHIAFVSEDTMNYFRVAQSFVTDCSVVHNGIDVEGRIQKHSHNSFVIGHIGDISRAKGWDLCLSAYTRIHEAYGKRIRFLSAGKALDYSPHEIEAMLSERGLQGDAEYLGLVANAAGNVMPDLDLVILASRNEGFALVLVEAMAHSIPILATRVGGMPEILKDGENGFFVENESDIARRVEQLFLDGNLYARMSTNAYRKYCEEFTLDHMGAKYEKIYTAQIERVHARNSMDYV